MELLYSTETGLQNAVFGTNIVKRTTPSVAPGFQNSEFYLKNTDLSFVQGYVIKLPKFRGLKNLYLQQKQLILVSDIPNDFTYFKFYITFYNGSNSVVKYRKTNIYDREAIKAIFSEYATIRLDEILNFFYEYIAGERNKKDTSIKAHAFILAVIQYKNEIFRFIEMDIAALENKVTEANNAPPPNDGKTTEPTLTKKKKVLSEKEVIVTNLELKAKTNYTPLVLIGFGLFIISNKRKSPN